MISNRNREAAQHARRIRDFLQAFAGHTLAPWQIDMLVGYSAQLHAAVFPAPRRGPATILPFAKPARKGPVSSMDRGTP